MASFLLCCVPSAWRKQDTDQLTPLGPLPQSTRRDAMNQKLKQSLASKSTKPAADIPSSRSTQGQQSANSSGQRFEIPNPRSPASKARADARELFRQAGLPAPDLGGGFQAGEPMLARPQAAHVKFERPRTAPAPPRVPTHDSSTRPGSRRPVTLPSSSSRRHEGSGSHTPRSDNSGRQASYRKYQAEMLHPGVRNDQATKSPRRDMSRPVLSHERSSNGSGNGVVSTMLGLGTSDRRRREQEEQAERERRQRSSDEYKRRQEASRVQQRGREREREREWHMRKQMELQELEKRRGAVVAASESLTRPEPPVAAGPSSMPSKSQSQGSSSRTRAPKRDGGERSRDADRRRRNAGRG